MALQHTCFQRELDWGGQLAMCWHGCPDPPTNPIKIMSSTPLECVLSLVPLPWKPRAWRTWAYHVMILWEGKGSITVPTAVPTLLPVPSLIQLLIWVCTHSINRSLVPNSIQHLTHPSDWHLLLGQWLRPCLTSPTQHGHRDHPQVQGLLIPWLQVKQIEWQQGISSSSWVFNWLMLWS